MKLLSKSLQKKVVLNSYRPNVFNIEPLEPQEIQGEELVEKKEVVIAEENNLQKDIEERLAKIELLEREAFEKGYSAGEKAGFEMGIKEAEVIIEKLVALLEELERLKENYLKESEKKILAIALAVARKIIEKEIKESDEVILNIVRNGVKKMERRERLIVTINPIMQNIIEKLKGDLSELCQRVIIDIDPNINEGMVKLESDTEEVIINFEEELSEIAKKLSSLL